MHSGDPIFTFAPATMELAHLILNTRIYRLMQYQRLGFGRMLLQIKLQDGFHQSYRPKCGSEVTARFK